ncbi:MAG: hypothetical protein WB989_29240, partial [Mycobacterium sp.]
MSTRRVPGGVVHKLPADLRTALIANSTALPRLLSSLLYFRGTTSSGVRTWTPAAVQFSASLANKSVSAGVVVEA